MNDCGCQNPPDYSLQEFHEIDIPKTPILIELPTAPDKTECLKEKIKHDYFCTLDKLECGIQPDIENILEEISLVDLSGKGYNIKNGLLTFIPPGKALLKENYLSEFKTTSEKKEVADNLGFHTHVILSKEEYDNLDHYEPDVIYLVTE